MVEDIPLCEAESTCCTTDITVPDDKGKSNVMAKELGRASSLELCPSVNVPEN